MYKIPWTAQYWQLLIGVFDAWKKWEIFPNFEHSHGDSMNPMVGRKKSSQKHVQNY